MKRFLTAFLALVFILLPFVGCADTTRLYKIDPTDEEARVVGKVGEFDVYYDELRYLTMTYKRQMESKYGEEIWKTEESAAPYIEELKSSVASALTVNYGALALAKENGITLDSEEVKKYCDLRLEEIAADLTLMLISSHGSQSSTTTSSDSVDDEYTPSDDEVNLAYRDQLEATYLTDRYVRFTFSVDACVEQLVIKYEKDGVLLTSDTDIEKYIKSNFCRTLHVYIRNDDGESVAENREKAETVIAELEGGKSFNSMVGSIYNDDLMTTTANGNYFGRGEMETAYEDAAFALDEGEYSEIVETESGFYIIKRLPLEDDYINTYFEDLKTQYKYAKVNSDISDVRDGLSFVPNELYNSIALWSMK
ncbi:MAG: hypothetical protein E7640_01530 [Ruminococcaceae bacterium]|nr:hypothetical protein [Oscillospiraceae bacterium]